MSAAAQRTLVRPPAGWDSADFPPSYLGSTLKFEGILDCAGEVHVHGSVQGRINADCLVVGRGGVVEGDVVAREVRIGGRFNGRVFAFNVILDTTADVTG